MAENYQVQINTNSRLRIGGAALILYRLFYPRVYMATCLASYPFTLGVLLAIHLPWPLNCGIMSITVIGIVLLIIGNNNTTEVNIDNLVRLLI